MPQAIATAAPDRMFESLANADYRRFSIGYGISLVGSWLQAAAVRWLVYEKTQSGWMLGVVEAAALMPGVLVALMAGSLADRVEPRRMIMTTQAASMALAFALAALVGLGVERIWQMALVVALTRICVTFEMPSRQVLLHDLVGKAALPNAIALNTGLFNASRVVGPALAGACLAVSGGAACFAMNGASYLAAIAALRSIRRDRPPSIVPRGSANVLGGLAYLRQDRRLGSLYLVMACFGVVGVGTDALIPAYAASILHTGVDGYGGLLASNGIGATCAALAMARLGRYRRKERLVLGGIFLFALAQASAAIVPAQIARTWPGPAALVAAAGCLAGVGFGAVLFFSATQTLIQTAVPDHLRGRIAGVWMIIYSATVPIGALMAGRLARDFDVVAVMVGSAALCAAMAAIVAARGTLSASAPSDIA